MTLLPALLAHGDAVFFLWMVLFAVEAPLGLALVVGFVLAYLARATPARTRARRGLAVGAIGTVLGGIRAIALLATTGWTILGPAEGVVPVLLGLPLPGVLLGALSGIIAAQRGESPR